MYIIWLSWIGLFCYCIFSIISKGYISPWNHHHQHVQTFSVPIMNRLLEVMYSLQTGITGYGWVLHHNLWHHPHYQDQTKDESAWKSPKWKRYNPLEYTGVVSLTSAYRSWIVWNKHKKIQRYFLYMMIIQAFIVISLIIFQPLQGIVLFLVPMITSVLITIYLTYHHHSWLESDDPYKSSYNITQWWYNLLTGNLGYHTAHHLKGSLHWSKLPEFHKTIQHKIDAKYYRKTNFFWYSPEKKT